MRFADIIITIALVLSFLNCTTTWNDKLIDGDINIQSEIPIGITYIDFKNYLTVNKIKRKNNYTGYTDKIFNNDFPFYIEDDVVQKVSYCIEIHGHRNYAGFPGYTHPVYYFCFDKDDILIYIGSHGYP